MFCKVFTIYYRYVRMIHFSKAKSENYIILMDGQIRRLSLSQLQQRNYLPVGRKEVSKHPPARISQKRERQPYSTLYRYAY